MKSILLPLALLFASAAHAELPQISDAFINQPPPGAPVAAGYFTINNTASEALIITGASTDQGGEIEVHLSEIIDDVATMSEQESITIEPGEQLEFRHGSYHLMLMGMSDILKPGSEVAVSLETNQGEVQFNMPVMAPGSSHDGMKNMKESMDDAGTAMEGMKHEGDAAAQ